jgi:xylan 1,4-beta-xylosidase
VRVTEYLIDAEHSNSYSAWRALGAPQDPSREELEAIKARSSLEPVRDETLESCPESLARQITLRCPAAALIEVAPA